MKKIFIIAGESSGDWLGAKLIKYLKNYHISGVGGSRMQSEGMKSIFPMQEISLMGFAEILPHVFNLKKRIKQTIQEIERIQPDMVLTIDSPGFNFRVAKAIQYLRPKTKLVHYVAPTVWAYKPERAQKINELFDKLLCLLPFEAEYFNNAVFVGHPVLEDGLDKGDKARFKEKYHIDDFICLMPGSRKNEIKKLLPIFLDAAKILHKTPVIIAADNVTLPNNIIKIPNSEKADCFAASSCGIIKSGTSGLEYAFSGKPFVVAYKANPISAWLIKCMIRIKFANLVNIIFNKEVIPELIQEECTSKNIANSLYKMKNFDKEELIKALSNHKNIPASQMAAEIIIDILRSD